MIGDLQPWHVILIVAVAFLLFGAKRMPDMARSVGQSLRIFKSEMRQGAKETEEMKAGEAVRVTPSAVEPSAPVVSSAPVTDAAQEKAHS
jgi:sec-independent protein translocase protein TatA